MESFPLIQEKTLISMFILKMADILPLCAYENIYFENKHFFYKIKIDIYWNHPSFIIKEDFLRLSYFFL